MELEILKKIGLSEGEIKVYSALLDEGSSPVNKIHEKVGFERRNIYDILNKLIEKGLISYITENKKRYFQLAHPHKIVAYIEEKEEKLENNKKNIEKYLPDMIKKFNITKPEIYSEIYRGFEGVKSVWEDTLNYPELRWIGSGRYIPIKFPVWFSNFNRRRIKAKCKWYNIFINESKPKVKQMPYEEMRFLPKEWSGNPTVIGIYGNKVVNFLLGEDGFAFVIESKELADNYCRYHKFLWDNVANK